MKQILAAMVIAMTAGGAYAKDLSGLRMSKASDAKMPAAAAKAEMPASAKPEPAEKMSSNFKYLCSSLDENAPYAIKDMAFESNGRNKPVLFSFQTTEYVTENYLIGGADIPKPGSLYAGFLKFNVENPDYETYSGSALTPFFVEEQLMTGGHKLENGKVGGFIKCGGRAEYLCVRL